MLAHVYGQPDGAIAVSDSRLTNDEARPISKLIARLAELVELERDWEQGQDADAPLSFIAPISCLVISWNGLP